jgi:hypothetical protein
LNPLAYLRNDTGRQIQVDGKYESGGFTIFVGPQGHSDIGVEKRFSLTVTSGKRVIATFGPMTDQQWKSYFDARKLAYYFRVTENNIVLVRPSAARGWHWDPEPERD